MSGSALSAELAAEKALRQSLEQRLLLKSTANAEALRAIIREKTVKVLVSPSGRFALRGLENNDETWMLNAIGGAKHSVKMHMYSVTSATFVKKLGVIATAKEPVSVLMVADKCQASHHESKAHYIISEIELMTMSVMMHAKVIVIDNSLVVLGSHYLTGARLEANFEVSLASRDRDLIDKINGLFTALQAITKPLDRRELLESQPQPCECCTFEFTTPARKHKRPPAEQVQRPTRKRKHPPAAGRGDKRQAPAATSKRTVAASQHEKQARTQTKKQTTAKMTGPSFDRTYGHQNKAARSRSSCSGSG